MTDELQIRSAEPGDGALLADLNTPVQQLHVMHEPEHFRADCEAHEVAAFFERVIARPNSHIEIAKLGTQAAGYLWFEHQRSERSAFKQALSRFYIHQLCTVPQHRRRGVARALVQTVRAWGEEQGVQQIALDSWAFNEEAHRFFESLGFGIYNLSMRLPLQK